MYVIMTLINVIKLVDYKIIIVMSVSSEMLGIN